MKKMLLIALAAMSLVGNVVAGKNDGEVKTRRGSCNTCNKCEKCPTIKCVSRRMVETCVAPDKAHNCPTLSCPAGSEQV